VTFSVFLLMISLASLNVFRLREVTLPFDGRLIHDVGPSEDWSVSAASIMARASSGTRSGGDPRSVLTTVRMNSLIVKDRTALKPNPLIESLFYPNKKKELALSFSLQSAQ
jgi:hypothetical protein